MTLLKFLSSIVINTETSGVKNFVVVEVRTARKRSLKLVLTRITWKLAYRVGLETPRVFHVLREGSMFEINTICKYNGDLRSECILASANLPGDVDGMMLWNISQSTCWIKYRNLFSRFLSTLYRFARPHLICCISLLGRLLWTYSNLEFQRGSENSLTHGKCVLNSPASVSELWHWSILFSFSLFNNKIVYYIHIIWYRFVMCIHNVTGFG